MAGRQAGKRFTQAAGRSDFPPECSGTVAWAPSPVEALVPAAFLLQVRLGLALLRLDVWSGPISFQAQGEKASLVQTLYNLRWFDLMILDFTTYTFI